MDMLVAVHWLGHVPPSAQLHRRAFLVSIPNQWGSHGATLTTPDGSEMGSGGDGVTEGTKPKALMAAPHLQQQCIVNCSIPPPQNPSGVKDVFSGHEMTGIVRGILRRAGLQAFVKHWHQDYPAGSVAGSLWGMGVDAPTCCATL
mmetsp:Transcript_34930/g.58460  ORF Transcript_34930/g.58460 Transcript_34930/m.58460 type:complete len:145 (+) Transcript_34930:1317-1751(+)